jgi:hypothetical protein
MTEFDNNIITDRDNIINNIFNNNNMLAHEDNSDYSRTEQEEIRIEINNIRNLLIISDNNSIYEFMNRVNNLTNRIINNQINTNSSIKCPVCKCSSTYDLDCSSCEIPQLEATCQICMTNNIDARLKCGHCFCHDCVRNFAKLTHLEIHPSAPYIQEVVRCKTCDTLHTLDTKIHRIYGVDVLCSHCQTEDVNIILPCKHYSCMKCLTI